MKKHIKEFVIDEEAQAMVEYALLAFILAVASYGGIKLFIAAWKTKFNKVKTSRSATTWMLL